MANLIFAILFEIQILVLVALNVRTWDRLEAFVEWTKVIFRNKKPGGTSDEESLKN